MKIEAGHETIAPSPLFCAIASHISSQIPRSDIIGSLGGFESSSMGRITGWCDYSWALSTEGWVMVAPRWAGVPGFVYSGMLLLISQAPDTTTRFYLAHDFYDIMVSCCSFSFVRRWGMWHKRFRVAHVSLEYTAVCSSFHIPSAWDIVWGA